MCDGGSGQCLAVARAGGGACDDGDPCTHLDQCDAGACVGTTLPMCGAQVSGCEPAFVPGAAEEAIAVAPFVDATTVMGRFDVASETNWWAVPVQADRVVTFETKPHCGSALDTIIGIYDADGNLLAEDDHSGADEFARVADVLIEEAGTVYVGVSAYAESGTDSYLLAVTVELPPPCVEDADCGCSELTCVQSGPDAGRCLPRMPAEVEPNHSPAGATALELGAEVHGELSSVAESDWFAVPLTAGLPVVFGTRGYCGAELETSVSVYAPDGVTQLGYAAGGGVAGHGLLEGFVAPTDGIYRVRVQSVAATAGEYVLWASAMTCTTDAQCACGDQVCSGDVAAPGLCVPAMPAPGPSEGGVELPLEARMHGEIGAAYEVDTYRLTLAAGSYDFETSGYCGEDMDTLLEVALVDGDVLASDDDSGEGFFAACRGVVLESMAVVEVRVSGRGPAVGPYLLRATPVAGN